MGTRPQKYAEDRLGVGEEARSPLHLPEEARIRNRE